MLLGVILLVCMSLLGRIAGLPGHQRELLNCMLTYSLLVSLTVTSWFNMGSTRYIADMLYEEKDEKIMPSFYGNVSIMLVICTVGYGIFLHFAGITFLQQLLCLWFALVLIIVWTEMIYMTAIKDYKSIVLSYTISLLLGFLLAIVFVMLGYVRIETFLFSMIVSYGILACRYHKLLLDYFPKAEGSNFSFLRWFDRYRKLVFAGGFVNIGLFSHLIIMYFGPLRVQVQGLFYGAPQYDVPAVFAFFSLLITTVNFVTSVEVEFYPKYSNYYGLFNDRGSILDIEQAGKEMLDVLWQQLTYASHKQVFTSVLFIVLGTPVLEALPLGMTALSFGVFRFLCVGYGSYAIANSCMLLLLYFEDYTGAAIGTFLFMSLSTGCNIWQILYGNVNYFGMGFFAGAMAFYLFVVIRLNWYSKKLPYFLLSKQSIIPVSDHGPLAWIADRLDDLYEDRLAEKEEKAMKKAKLEAMKEGLIK